MNATTIATTTQVTNFVKTISKGTFGNTMVALTSPTMNKRGNPFVGRVTKVTYLSNVAIGYNYANRVNAILTREDKADDFVAQPLKGKRWVKGMANLISHSISNPNQHYLRVTMLPNTHIESVYLIDDHKATDEEMTILSRFLTQINKPTNQGVNEGNEVVVKDYKVESVVYLSQAKKVHNVTDLTIEQIKEFLRG